MNGFVGPELLGDAHTLEGFDCGTEPLTRWLIERARRNQNEGSSRTWVVTAGERVVAYYASRAAKAYAG